MSIVINGSGTISGISVGGLPDSIVDAGTLATNSVDSAELIDGAVDTAHIAANQITSAIMPTGSVLQVVNVIYSSQTTINSNTWSSIGLAAAITPTSSSSKILATVYVTGIGSGSAQINLRFRLVRGSTSIIQFENEAAYAAAFTSHLSVGATGCSYLDSPSTTSATTYTVQGQEYGGNATGYAQLTGSSSTITLMEIAG